MSDGITELVTRRELSHVMTALLSLLAIRDEEVRRQRAEDALVHFTAPAVIAEAEKITRDAAVPRPAPPIETLLARAIGGVPT